MAQTKLLGFKILSAPTFTCYRDSECQKQPTQADAVWSLPEILRGKDACFTLLSTGTRLRLFPDRLPRLSSNPRGSSLSVRSTCPACLCAAGVIGSVHAPILQMRKLGQRGGGTWLVSLTPGRRFLSN